MDIEVVQYRNIKKVFFSCEGLTRLECIWHSMSKNTWVTFDHKQYVQSQMSCALKYYEHIPEWFMWWLLDNSKNILEYFRRTKDIYIVLYGVMTNKSL